MRTPATTDRYALLRAARPGSGPVPGWAGVTLLTLLVATVGALLIFGTRTPPPEPGRCAAVPEPIPVEQVEFEGEWPALLPEEPAARPTLEATAPAANRSPAARAQPTPRRPRLTPSLPPPARGDLLTTRASAFFEQGHYWSAAGLYLRATQARPANPDAWYGLALCHYELGQRGAAVSAGDRALKLDSKHGGAAILLGFIAQERGRYDTSRRLYERYLAERPDGDHAQELRSVLAQLPRGSAAPTRR